MAKLIDEILRSVFELDLSFKGEMTIIDQIETLMDSIYLDQVPAK